MSAPALAYARRLLSEPGFAEAAARAPALWQSHVAEATAPALWQSDVAETSPHATREDAAASAAFDWARSGALPLTGRADGPPVLPGAPLATVASGAALALAMFAPELSGLDGARLLGERAALERGIARRGRSSASGAARLLRARDGFVAVNLPRGAEDFRLLPAWIECPFPRFTAASHEENAREEIWEALARALATRPAREAVARARLLGLPVAPCPPMNAAHAQPNERVNAVARAQAPGAHATRAGLRALARTRAQWRRGLQVTHAPSRATPPWLVVTRAGARGALRVAPRVLDLSALWAGPLAGQLLAQSGARVVKVESRRRPDAARRGNPALFALLNGAKEQRALDFGTRAGRRELAREFRAADVVLEASRPRALQQLGFDAQAWLAARPGRVWCGLSGYGRDAPGDAWVALGDDAAAAAGLCHCVAAARAPLFVGDAIADPLAGVHAALAVHAALRRGGGELLDLRLAGVVAHAIAQRAFAPVSGRVVATRAGFEVQSGGQSQPVEAPRARRLPADASLRGGSADTRARAAPRGGVAVRNAAP